MKAVDVEWRTELAAAPAKPTDHYLVVYVAVTGEMADRLSENAFLNHADLALNCPDGGCSFRPERITAFETVADGQWRDFHWRYGDTARRAEIPAGATRIGAVAFPVPDTVALPGGVSFCARGRDKATGANCVPVAPPPRG